MAKACKGCDYTFCYEGWWCDYYGITGMHHPGPMGKGCPVRHEGGLGRRQSPPITERAARLEGPLVLAIGNAPTALIRIKELVDQGKLHPKLIIAVPVGFVNVVQAKELILDLDIPYIVARGRKGGSNVAAAICNALLYQLYI